LIKQLFGDLNSAFVIKVRMFILFYIIKKTSYNDLNVKMANSKNQGNNAMYI